MNFLFNLIFLIVEVYNSEELLLERDSQDRETLDHLKPELLEVSFLCFSYIILHYLQWAAELVMWERKTRY